MSLVCTNHPCHSYNCPQWAWHWCIPIITSLKFHWILIYSIVHYRIVKTIAGYKKRKLTSWAIQPNIVSSLAVAEGALCPCPLQRPLPFALGSGSAHLPPPLHSERTFCRLADSGGFVMYQLMWTLKVHPMGRPRVFWCLSISSVKFPTLISTCVSHSSIFSYHRSGNLFILNIRTASGSEHHFSRIPWVGNNRKLSESPALHIFLPCTLVHYL